MTAYDFTLFRDRIRRPTKPLDGGGGDGDGEDEGPKRPDVNKPDTKELLRRMKRVDKDQSRRYRQRTGE
jgi:hypothetical protein